MQGRPDSGDLIIQKTMSTETMEATLVMWHNKSFTSSMSQKLISSVSHGATGTHRRCLLYLIATETVEQSVAQECPVSCMSFCLIPIEKNISECMGQVCFHHYVSLSTDIGIRHENALWTLWKTRDHELKHHSHIAWCPGYSVINRALLFDFLNKLTISIPGSICTGR